VIGSHSGSVHIFDHEGNRITDKQFQSHDITVNQLSIDEKGEYIASCSDDGKVRQLAVRKFFMFCNSQFHSLIVVTVYKITDVKS